MEILIRLAAATALTMASAFICQHAHAQEAPTGPYKISCHSADNKTKFDGILNSEAPKTRLTNLIIVHKDGVHRPTLNPQNIEFYFDATAMHVSGKLPNGQVLIFAAQPSVSEHGTWTGTLSIDSDSTKVSCDLL